MDDADDGEIPREPGSIRPSRSPELRRIPGREVPGSSDDDGATGCGLERGGLPGPVNAGRQPREVAPGSYVLVLRDVPPGASRAGIRGLPSDIQLSVQLILQRYWRAPSSSSSRLVDQAQS